MNNFNNVGTADTCGLTIYATFSVSLRRLLDLVDIKFTSVTFCTALINPTFLFIRYVNLLVSDLIHPPPPPPKKKKKTVIEDMDEQA